MLALPFEAGLFYLSMVGIALQTIMHPKYLKIEDYTYDLPQEKIAKYPLEVRDSSKLLVYRNGNMVTDTYHNITNHIEAGKLMVFNQTKVVHARLLFKKDTGSTIEIFCLEPHEQYAEVHTAMLQKGTVMWNCMVGGASKWKDGMVLTLHHNSPDFSLSATMMERDAGVYVIQLEWDQDLTFAEVLHYAGHVPLPPYLQREAEVNDEARYQTIYAKEEGSVAAPTAGLHFTPQVMDSIAQKGIDTSYVTLHVGAGTFKPVKATTMEDHDMHAEWIQVDKCTVESLLTHLDKGIVAVGTTSTRTLESLYWIGCKLQQHEQIDWLEIAVTQWEPYKHTNTIDTAAALHAIIEYMNRQQVQRIVTRTQILIAPGYDFKVISGIATNFHQPQSTLLLLIAAFIGDEWRNIYQYALDNEYRFLSYGDGCLLLK